MSPDRTNFNLTSADLDLIHVIKRHVALADERTDFMRDVQRIIDRYERKSPKKDQTEEESSLQVKVFKREQRGRVN